MNETAQSEQLQQVEQTTAMVALADGPLARLSQEQVDDRVKAIERSCETVKRMIRAGVKLTYPQQWIDVGDKPYLEGEGALNLCPLGVTVRIVDDFDYKTIGNDIFVEVLVEATWRETGHSIVEIGDANTRDKLWNTKSDRSTMNQFLERAGGDEKIARQMLLGWVKKKALMNAYSRAIRGVLGMRGLSWDDLEPLGITREKAGGRVRFSKGATKASHKAAKAAPVRVSLAEMLGLPQGSVCAVGGTILKAAARGKGHFYRITEGELEATVVVWWNDPTPLPDFATEGTAVYFPIVEVREYQGNAQYAAQSIEAVEAERPAEAKP